MYNRFAEKRRRYLREHRDGIYTGMLLTGKLEDQLKEIGDAKLLAGEEEQLTEQQKCIRNAERITESLGTVYTLLNGDGEELKGALETLEEVSVAGRPSSLH